MAVIISRLRELRTRLDEIKIAGRPLTWYVSGWRFAVIFLVLAFSFPTLSGDQTLIFTVASITIYVLLALGLNIVVGYAGLLDLGYVAFFVLGAYTSAIFSTGVILNPDGKAQTFPAIPFWAIFPLAIAIASFFGVILGAPTLRLRGDYLAIVTLGFGEILPRVFRNVAYFNGAGGLSATKPDPLVTPFFTLDLSSFIDWSGVYYLGLFLVGVAVVLVTLLRESSLGRAWIAIREDETAAAASGVNLVRVKLLAFGLGASIGGASGVLYTLITPHIEPSDFTFNISITILVMIVLGGISSIPGVIVGASLLKFYDLFIATRLNETVRANGLVAPTDAPLHFLSGFDFNQSRLLFYGVILLLMILLRPQGLIPDVRRRRELKGVGIAAEGLSVIGEITREEVGEAVIPETGQTHGQEE